MLGRMIIHALLMIDLSGAVNITRSIPNVNKSKESITIVQSSVSTAKSLASSVSHYTRTIECRKTQLGETYSGSVFQTAANETCQIWSQLNQTSSNEEHFPGVSMVNSVNYCRNPNKDSKGIWCYTDFPRRHGYCNAPFCGNIKSVSKTCKRRLRDTGHDYTGNLSHSLGGHQCQAWHQQTPNKHTVGIYDHEFPDADIYDAGNFCRNPIGVDDLEPWCYTTTPGLRWQACRVPKCNVTKRLNDLYTADYPRWTMQNMSRLKH